MNPFLPDEVEALRALVRTWPNSEMVILGAGALRCFMPMSWRTTEDLDLSVAASIEEATAALSLLPGWSSDPRQEQRWRTPAGIAVDIVPASTEALARRYVEWPRSGFRMSLLGMRLAFEHAVVLRIAADVEVRVAPIHVISVLKMIAYLDRPEVRAKRRHAELVAKNPSHVHSESAILSAINQRDEFDSTREIAPLRCPAV